MIIDGRAIAGRITTLVSTLLREEKLALVLGIVIVGSDPVIEGFVRIKKKKADEIGVRVEEFRFPSTVTTEELQSALTGVIAHAKLDGCIVQLPLPAHIDAQKILNAIPLEKDVDMLAQDSLAAFRRGDAPILPPVAGAIKEILDEAKVSVHGKEAIVLGHGRLVGVPATLLLRHNGAHVTVVDKPMANLAEHVHESDIVICGVGQPNFLTPDMLKKGAVVIDAGTSEAGGKLVGDAEPECAHVASVFTPVPGGVGPITIALIFKNLLVLAQGRSGV